jgi:hypothetical protein
VDDISVATLKYSLRLATPPTFALALLPSVAMLSLKNQFAFLMPVVSPEAEILILLAAD